MEHRPTLDLLTKCIEVLCKRYRGHIAHLSNNCQLTQIILHITYIEDLLKRNCILIKWPFFACSYVKGLHGIAWISRPVELEL